MKKSIKILALIVMICVSGRAAAADQHLKLGHINSAELLRMMPETDSVEKKLQAYAKEVEETMKSMENELQTRYTEYQNQQAQLSDLLKAAKVRELQDLQSRLEDFSKQAQQDLQTQKEKFLSPIIDKAQKAISEVAKEQSFSYVFDVSSGAVLYTDGGEDLMPLVKKKLGLK